MRSNKIRTWKDGATFIYQSKITNGAGGGGTVLIQIAVPANAELEILYGSVVNGDTSSRTGEAYITDGTTTTTNIMAYLAAARTLTAAGRGNFPAAEAGAVNGAIGAGASLILSGGMELVIAVYAVAASEDVSFGFAGRIRGQVPVVSETGNSTPTIAIAVEKVV